MVEDSDLILGVKSLEAFVNWIDKDFPLAVSLTYGPATFTTGGVTARLETNEPIQTPFGWTALSGTVFTRVFT
jgi:hypothetical protein